MKENKPTITFAPDLEISRLEIGGWINKALEAIGHPEALVTDYSSVWDFMDNTGDPHDIEWLNERSEAIGFEIEKSDLIWRLAERLKKESDQKNAL